MLCVKHLGLYLVLALNKNYFHFHFDWKKITEEILSLFYQFFDKNIIPESIQIYCPLSFELPKKSFKEIRI